MIACLNGSEHTRRRFIYSYWTILTFFHVFLIQIVTKKTITTICDLVTVAVSHQGPRYNWAVVKLLTFLVFLFAFLSLNFGF